MQLALPTERLTGRWGVLTDLRLVGAAVAVEGADLVAEAIALERRSITVRPHAGAQEVGLVDGVARSVVANALLGGAGSNQQQEEAESREHESVTFRT